MRLILTLILCGFLFALSPQALAQSPTKAQTETGKEVLLYPDGTWKYAEEAQPTTPGTYVKPPSAKKPFKSKNGVCGIWVDESKWKQESENNNEDFEFAFSHTSGDAYGGVIVERIGMPLAALKEVALGNARKTDPNLKVVSEEKRLVNGHEVLCILFEIAPNQVPLTFYGYYYSGKGGSVQLITWTGTNLFDEYKQDLTNFLNGLEVYK